MKILGIDCETTGLTAGIDRIIEIGVATFKADTWVPLTGYETFVYEKDYPKSSKDAQAAHRIPIKDLKMYGIPFVSAVLNVETMVKDCDAVIAHNAPFDKGMLLAQAKEKGLEGLRLFSLPWLCSKQDIPYNNKMKSKSLRHLAIDHGIAVDPKNLHRSLPDVLLMGEVLRAIGISGKHLLDHCKLAEYIIEAETTYEQREKPKLLGYTWNPDKKKWFKSVRETSLKIELAKATFPTKVQKLEK